MRKPWVPGEISKSWRRVVSLATHWGEGHHHFVLESLVGLLAGRRLDGVTMTQPTRFRVGDGLSLHNDAQDSRVVAFAWHLGWEPGDGGELAFLCPEEEEGGHLVRPRRNTLTLFRTDATTGAARGFLGAHAVLPVLRNGTDRYALSGWFTLGDQKSG